ncbi:MAG: hypothetical protein ACMUHB_02855 [Thermoplasmatota archaeon]
MRIGDVGAVSPAGDLLAFSLAVVMIVALVAKVGTIEEDREGSSNGLTILEVNELHDWGGFDPDGDGVLDPYPGTDTSDTQGVHVVGSVVARMVFGDDVVEHLFVDGRYGGRVHDSKPISRVVGITSLFESEGMVHCGTFDCYFVEAVT